MSNNDLLISHTALKMLEDYLSMLRERKDEISLKCLQEDINHFKKKAKKIIEDN